MSNDPNRPFAALFGNPSSTNQTDNFLNDILAALQGSGPKPTTRGLGGFLDPIALAPTPTQNALAALFGSPAPAPKPMGLLAAFPDVLPANPSANALAGIFGLRPSTPPPIAPVAPQVRRKVFFSFHFEGDIRRSCIVRNSYRFRPGRKLGTANFYDRSLWESSKREGEESLKRLIREGMAGSSVTCVLAGSQTWARPWVRYEIARSLVCGNGLFTVHIHNVKDPRDGFAEAGHNPLAFMGLQLRPDGRGNICEMIEGQWYPFRMHKLPVAWPRWLPKPDFGRLFALNLGARSYDYHFDHGFNGLAEWAQLAARESGRA